MNFIVCYQLLFEIVQLGTWVESQIQLDCVERNLYEFYCLLSIAL